MRSSRLRKIYCEDLKTFSKINGAVSDDKVTMVRNVLLTSNTISPISRLRCYKNLLSGGVNVFLFDGVLEIDNYLNNKKVIDSGYSKTDLSHCQIILVSGKKAKKIFDHLGFLTIPFVPNRLKYSNEDFEMSDKEKRFLITTSNTPYFNDLEYELLLSIIEKLVESLNQKGFEVIYRLFDSRLIRDLGVASEINYCSGRLDDVLGMCDVVFCTPSSVFNSANDASCLCVEINNKSYKSLSPVVLQVSSPQMCNSVVEEISARSTDLLQFQKALFLDEYQSDYSLSSIIEEGSKVNVNIDKSTVLELMRVLNKSRYTINFERILRFFRR